MPLNPQTAAFFQAMAENNPDGPQTHEQSPADARQGYLALAHVLGPGPDLANVEDRTIKGSESDIPVRVYSPTNDETLPCLIYFHGGGWVIGDLDSHDRECRLLADGAGCRVIAVDYRLAPEHVFPAAHTDCWDATRFIADNAAGFGIDAANLAVGGDSAGGNLAAFVALKARDEGLPLKLQMLIYPATDARAHHPTSTAEHWPSLIENAEAVVLTRATMQYFATHLMKGLDPVTVASDWRMSPLLADDHGGVAPAFIATCEMDPIRDEGNAYAGRLTAAGVAVNHKVWAGQPHLLFQLSPVLDDGKALIAESAAALKAAFA